MPHLRKFTTSCSGILHGFCAAWLVSTALCTAADTDEKASGKLLTGEELTRALDVRRSLRVRDIPLRRVVQQLQEQAGFCILVDRRIDPSQRLTLRTDLVATDELLRTIAAELPSAGVSVNRAFVYLGPARVARSLRTLCELHRVKIREARSRLGPATYGKLLAVESLSWAELESPRDILIRLADRVRLPIVNPELIPHDRWHAGTLPDMPFAESATALLCQFDLTCEVELDPAQIRIVPVPDVVLLDRRHRLSRRDRRQAERLLSDEFPGLQPVWERFGVRLSATYEQHEQIMRLLSGISGRQKD